MRFAGLIVVLFPLFLVAVCSDADDPGPTTPVENNPVFNVTYLGNGSDSGDAPTDATDYQEGDLVTVAGPGTLARTGYAFDSWKMSADGTGPAFAMGTADTTLYAQWREEVV
jgi:uncharacterized repeat protein (TIGR02543 family)